MRACVFHIVNTQRHFLNQKEKLSKFNQVDFINRMINIYQSTEDYYMSMHPKKTLYDKQGWNEILKTGGHEQSESGG